MQTETSVIPQSATAAAKPAPIDREPDVVIDVLEWKGEPTITAMASKGGEPKLKRLASVRAKNGQSTIVEVVGTAKQFEYASDVQVEGYLGSDKTRMYFQPHLSGAAPANLFI